MTSTLRRAAGTAPLRPSGQQAPGDDVWSGVDSPCPHGIAGVACRICFDVPAETCKHGLRVCDTCGLVDTGETPMLRTTDLTASAPHNAENVPSGVSVPDGADTALEPAVEPMPTPEEIAAIVGPAVYQQRRDARNEVQAQLNRRAAYDRAVKAQGETVLLAAGYESARDALDEVQKDFCKAVRRLSEYRDEIEKRAAVCRVHHLSVTIPESQASRLTHSLTARHQIGQLESAVARARRC
jgi:hypothetical protein